MDDVFSKTPREGETAEQMIARHLAQARPFEVAWLFLLRSSENGIGQREVYQAYLNARAIFWTRLAVFMAALSLPIAIVAAIIGAS